MNRHLTRRAPTKNGGFSWGRFPMGLSGNVAYRLFRRDLSGAIHIECLHFLHRDSRRDISIALRAACHRLRDRVDEIDLAAIGVEA